MRWPTIHQILALPSLPSPPLSLPDDTAFDLHARAVTLRNLRLAALFIAAASVGGLALDRLVHAGSPAALRTLTELRLGHAILGAAGYAALLWPGVARRPLAAAIVLTTLGGALIGRAAGLLGGLDAPWFHFSHAVLTSLLTPLVALRLRVVLAFTMPAALVAALVVSSPVPLRLAAIAPTLAFLVFVAGVAVGVGHMSFLLVRRNLEGARATERLKDQLTALTGSLEERVQDQTREVRLLATHLESAREDERAHVARELHDELGQELTALRYALGFLRKRYERDPASVRRNLDEIDALVARTSATTRQILAELRPRIVDDLGLVAGVEWLVARTGERTGLDCRLTTAAGAAELDPELSNAAFRIVQESLTNAARHARATRVDVEIAVDGGDLRVTVRDDGAGMPARPAARDGRGTMGLIGIRERAEALGGALHIESAPGRGTAVIVRLPLAGRRGAWEVAA